MLLVAPPVFRAPEAPAAVCAGGRRPASLMVLLVAPRVFRAPEGPAAVCAGGRWPASLMVLLVAPRVFRAPEGPAAREARASLRSAPRLEARPGPVPRSVPYPQFRMQFPDTCSSSLSEKPGISTITFQSMKCAWENCMRICADQAPPPPTGTAAWPAASWGRHGGLAC